jgi:hypothetical protein
MNMYMTAFAVLLLGAPVLGDDASARAQLMGAWQQQDASGKGISVWVVETKGNALHITNQGLSVKEPLRERSLRLRCISMVPHSSSWRP